MKTTAVLLLVAGAVALVQGSPRVAPISLPSHADSRIIGGVPAVNGEFPYHAFLVNYGVDGSRIACGGSLISREWVLTAAECLTNALDIYVHLGHINIGESPVIKVASLIIPHPSYKGNLHHDIGLIKLNTPVVLTDNISVIAFEKKEHFTYEGVVALLTGFGGAIDSSTLSRKLGYTSLKVISNKQCAEFSENGKFSPANMCAVEVNSEARGIPTGDSGSPLITNANGFKYQIGIASFGANGGRATDVPSTFVRTSHYAYWIYLQTNIR